MGAVCIKDANKNYSKLLYKSCFKKTKNYYKMDL